MKKQALLLSALGMLAFASCETEVANNDEAYIDSVVNARVEEMRMEMMMQNDSLIYALAQEKADSIIAAMKGGSAVTTKTTTTRTSDVTILLNDFGSFSNPITINGTVNGSSLTIPNQTQGGITISGSGTYNNGVISINYTSQGTVGASETCNATWTKQ